VRGGARGAGVRGGALDAVMFTAGGDADAGTNENENENEEKVSSSPNSESTASEQKQKPAKQKLNRQRVPVTTIFILDDAGLTRYLADAKAWWRSFFRNLFMRSLYVVALVWLWRARERLNLRRRAHGLWSLVHRARLAVFEAVGVSVNHF